MKRTILNYHYHRLLTLFHKLQSRLNRSFLTGRFKQLSKRQQYKLLQRLEKLRSQIARFENGMKYGSMALATAAGLSLSPMESMAQFAPEGPEFQVNEYTTGVQQSPKVAMDADGDFVITWASRGQDGSNEYSIYAQRYNAIGMATSAEFRVNTYTVGRQSAPVIAMEDDGDFVIVWTSSGQDGNMGGIFGQRFKASGQAASSEFQINTYTTGNQYSPSVAMDNDGDFVVTWSSPGGSGTSYDIYARRYNAAGSALSGEFKVNTYDADVQRFSTIAMDNDGDFVITWPSNNQDGSGYGIYGQRYNNIGTAQGAEFRVNTYTTASQSSQSVAMDENGDFVVAWVSSGQDGSGDGIYAQRYNAAGVAQGAEFRVNTYTTSTQSFPAVAMDDAGNFVITWQSQNQDGSGTGVYVQRYNAAGIAQGTEFRVNTYTTNDQKQPAIAIDNDSDFVIAWTSDLIPMGSGTAQDGSGAGVFAQRYEENFAPTDISLSNNSVNENVAVNTEIGTLSSTDPDNGDTFTYSFTNGTGDEDNASFTIADDKLLINESPNFETKSSYSIRIRSTDQDGLFFEKVFTITITDVNEAPVNISLSANSVNENVDANTEIGTFTATDEDASNTFTYSLISGTGDADNASFTIDDDKLLINESPDFETKNSYNIRVEVTDQDGLSFEKEFTITINKVTGIANTFSTSIQLYPNPAKSTVLMNLEGAVQVRILDLSGHAISQTQTTNKMIHIEGIPSGVYMLEFTQNDKTGWKKLVIE